MVQFKVEPESLSLSELTLLTALIGGDSISWPDEIYVVKNRDKDDQSLWKVNTNTLEEISLLSKQTVSSVYVNEGTIYQVDMDQSVWKYKGKPNQWERI